MEPLHHWTPPEMTLAWAEIKPMIREIVCPVFVDLGFASPGLSMWRHREQFIDVVQFRSPRSQLIQVAFGCTPRLTGVGQPLPWNCHFSVQPTLDLGADADLLNFAATAGEQRGNLTALAKQLGPAAETWFGYFSSPGGARQALGRNALRGPRHVRDGKPGSPAYLATMAALDQLES